MNNINEKELTCKKNEKKEIKFRPSPTSKLTLFGIPFLLIVTTFIASGFDFKAFASALLPVARIVIFIGGTVTILMSYALDWIFYVLPLKEDSEEFKKGVVIVKGNLRYYLIAEAFIIQISFLLYFIPNVIVPLIYS